jgi:hypothetical protein
MATSLVAIHQPNFLPWLGFFDKLARADVFVVLDDVQFPKKGGTWMNRVQLLVNGEASWLTVPVDRSYHGNRLVLEMRTDESRPWREKAVKTIESAYGGSPHFGEVQPRIHELLANPTDRLAEHNEHSLRALASDVGLDTDKLVRSSTLTATSAATDRLVELVRAVGGDAYLSGGGAGGYQEEEKFGEAGIELVMQDFQHLTYPQPTDSPVHGLSIVDALMNCGFERTGELLRRSG